MVNLIKVIEGTWVVILNGEDEGKGRHGLFSTGELLTADLRRFPTRLGPQLETAFEGLFWIFEEQFPSTSVRELVIRDFEILIDLFQHGHQTLFALALQLLGDLNQMLSSCLEGGELILHQVQACLALIVLFNGHHVDVAEALHAPLQVAKVALKFTHVFEILREVVDGQVGVDEFLAHELDFGFFVADGSHQLLSQTTVVLRLVQSLFVSHAQRGPLVGQFLTFLLQTLILFEVDRLLIFLDLERGSVGRQGGFKFIDANETRLLVLVKSGETRRGFIHPPLKKRLVACTAAEDAFGLFLGPVGFDAQQVSRMHTLTEMFGTGGVQGLPRHLAGFG